MLVNVVLLVVYCLINMKGYIYMNMNTSSLLFRVVLMGNQNGFFSSLVVSF